MVHGSGVSRFCVVSPHAQTETPSPIPATSPSASCLPPWSCHRLHGQSMYPWVPCSYKSSDSGRPSTKQTTPVGVAHAQRFVQAAGCPGSLLTALSRRVLFEKPPRLSSACEYKSSCSTNPERPGTTCMCKEVHSGRCGLDSGFRSGIHASLLSRVCMYACMHACTYVCMYVCMPVCMHACMHACK